MQYIKADHVKYRYPGAKKLALSDVSFEVTKAEIIGIIGANGSGKTTLAQAVVGLVPQLYKGAYGGCLMVGEHNCKTTPIAKLCREVGIVFQNPYNQLSGAKDTVYEETAFGLLNYGVAKEEVEKRVKEALTLVRMWEFRDRNPFELSGGQTQRVALASILAMQPQLLILDEPTSQLDPLGSEEVFESIKQLAATGITILIIEHKMDMIATYCNRVMLLEQGEVKAFDRPEVIFSRDDLESFHVSPPGITVLAKKCNIHLSDGIYPMTMEQILPYQNKIHSLLVPQKGEKGKKISHILKLERICFSYHKKQSLLSEVTLSFGNECTAIIGQNGAGKTTLIRLMKGLLLPDQGVISLQGTELSKLSVAENARRIGFIFQNPEDSIFKSKVIDEIMFGPLAIGMSQEQAHKQALDALALTGLLGLEQKNPYDLELAQRKLLSIASVLAMDPEVVIFDEPVIALDAEEKERVGVIFRRLKAQNKTVIAVLHDMQFVKKHCERIVVMAEGRVLLDGGHEIFMEKELLKKACVTLPKEWNLLPM